MSIFFNRIQEHAIGSSLALLLCLTTSSGCNLFATVSARSCEDLPSTCVCPGGSIGEAQCDEVNVVIVACSCATATQCQETERELCRCQDTPDAAIGLTSCVDTSRETASCVCQEFAPPGAPPSNAPQPIAQLQTSPEIDGFCDEFQSLSTFPASGLASSSDLPRQSCRLAWSAASDGGALLHGCCIIPDNELTYDPNRTSEDVSMVGLEPNDPGDDRLEIIVGAQQADAPLYYAAISNQAPAPNVLDAAFEDLSTFELDLTADLGIQAISRPVGTPNDPTGALDTGYALEWTLRLPQGISRGDRFDCQLVRHDIQGVNARVAEQEQAFGDQASLSPAAQPGTCLLQ